MDRVPDEVLDQIIDEALNVFYPLDALEDLELVSKRFRRLAVSVYLHRGHCLHTPNSVYRMMDRGLIDQALEDMKPLHRAKKIDLIKLEACGTETIRYFVRRWQTRHLILTCSTWRKIRGLIPKCHMLTTISLGGSGYETCDLIEVGSILSSSELVREITMPHPSCISVQELRKANIAWRTVPTISVGSNLQRSVLPALRFFLEKTTPSYLTVSSCAIQVEQALSGLLTDSIKSGLKRIQISGRAPILGLSPVEHPGLLDGVPEVTVEWRLATLTHGGPQYMSNPQLRLGRTLHINGTTEGWKGDRERISALEQACQRFWETVDCRVDYVPIRQLYSTT